MSEPRNVRKEYERWKSKTTLEERSAYNREKYLRQKARLAALPPEVRQQRQQEVTRRATAACREFKMTCVNYKGGACESCGLVDIPDVYDFHHKKPQEKEFAIAAKGLTSFTDEVKRELDKCSLLCANCHRREHYRVKREADNTARENAK